MAVFAIRNALLVPCALLGAVSLVAGFSGSAMAGDQALAAERQAFDVAPRQHALAAESRLASAQARPALPEISVKAGHEVGTTVRAHSSFNPQGERCLGRMLPFAGASFQR
ncbi:MAG: hypothetical protein H6R04_88 [Burkholderiaceae bacterium]|nr:hypothetical protein [Burkholderiaceae bacterium]